MFFEYSNRFVHERTFVCFDINREGEPSASGSNPETVHLCTYYENTQARISTFTGSTDTAQRFEVRLSKERVGRDGIVRQEHEYNQENAEYCV